MLNGLPSPKALAVTLVALMLVICTCVAFAPSTAAEPLATTPNTNDAAISSTKAKVHAAQHPADATQQRVRELIYVLRGHRVFDRNDQWAAAVRELTEIGSPARTRGATLSVDGTGS